MKTLTTEQFNALPEDKKRYWKRDISILTWSKAYYRYTPIQINLEDAERVLEEAVSINAVGLMFEPISDYGEGWNDGIKRAELYLTTALNNLKQLTK